MIVQYIIDWKCVRERIDRANDLTLERLRGCLSSLREKISENGVLVVDEYSCLLDDLNAVKCELEDLVSDDQPDCGAVYFDMKQELESFLNAYVNAGYMISVENREDVVQACVSEWIAHARRISPQGIKGGVVITDRSEDLENGTLAVESWESYGISETESIRTRWKRGMSFNERTRSDFLDCVKSFAATSYGEVLFVDKYWGSVGVLTAGGGSTTRQQRYINSTMMFLDPFFKNPDVQSVDFITTVPQYEDGEAPYFCVNCKDGICEKMRAMVATRRGELSINVMFVEPDTNARDAQFHNRYMVNNSWTVALLNGMDICNRTGELIDFQMILFGTTVGSDNLSRGHVASHRIRRIAKHEVDIQNPYVVSIRNNPRVLFSLKG